MFFVTEVSQLSREFLIYQAESKPGPGEPVLIGSAPGKPSKHEQGPRRNSRRGRDTCYTGTCPSNADYPWYNKQSQFRAIFALCSNFRWVYLTKFCFQMFCFQMFHFHSVWVGDNTFKVTVIFIKKTVVFIWQRYLGQSCVLLIKKIKLYTSNGRFLFLRPR